MINYEVRALIRLEAVYLLAIDMFAASVGNRLGFVSKCKISMDFGVKPLIHVKSHRLKPGVMKSKEKPLRG